MRLLGHHEILYRVAKPLRAGVFVAVVLAAIIPQQADASGAPHVIAFSASATSLASTAGSVIFLSEVSGAAINCTLDVSPTVTGVPVKTPCAFSLSWPVTLPSNVTAKAIAYKFTLEASYQAGATTKSVKSKPITVTVDAPPPSTYISLGDSFSSGEGNPAKSGPAWLNTEGFPTQTEQGCHRSAAAYPMLTSKWLRTQHTLPSMDLRFLACSGETTEDIWNSHALASGLVGAKGTEPKQLNDTSDLAAARIVTVTTGGDDIDFPGVLAGCIIGKATQTGLLCSSISPNPWIANVAGNIDELKPILVSTYRRIERSAPHAALYVLGYPDLFPPAPSPIQLATCDSIATGMLSDEIAYLIFAENRLTAMIKAAANDADAHYVDPNTGKNSFIGRDICSKHPWFNQLDLIHREYSFHPNAAGQKALAKDIEEAIASNATPTGPPPLPGTVAFVHSELGQTNIWSEKADGTGLKQLTSGASDYRPAISPDGARVAYEHTLGNGTSELWIVNSDGSDAHEVPNSPSGYGASWSPDDTSIVFTRAQDTAIYRINADGTGLTTLAHAESPTFPHYSPDGSTIYYGAYSGYFSIWRMDATGSNQTQLTYTDQDAYSPAPSPDGTSIAYNSYSERNFEGFLTSNSDIFTAETNGAAVRDMTEKFLGSQREDFYPSWSPDSKHLAYATQRCADDGSTCIRIGDVAEPEEENETQLTPQDWNANEPSWGP